MRGRKPGPPELRVVKGDKRVRGLAAAEPLRPAQGEPDMPGTFDDEHAAKWREVVAMMREMGTLGREVGDLVRVYVESAVEAQRARALVAEHGVMVAAPRTGVPMHSPYRTIARQAEATMVKLAAELGLTPSSRSRIGKRSQDGGNAFAGHGRRA